ncbi:MAG: SusD/RagB family nutrient-binding outer membrane lipoprotein [Lentimicrobiaceae bacterium]|nr:SusD/RagB family nutrient-binding outer membrane lipoprotein [Lentimicrobiaceae bacterium]
MKKNMINIKNILLASTVILAFAFGSCTKGFEEMNKNPMSPTGTDIGPLFNGVVSSLTWTWDEQFYLNNEIFYPESELGALISESWGNYSIGVDAVWNNYYLALANIHDIDRRLDEMCTTNGDDEIDDKVRAQLTIIEAYKTFKVTDMFGDIPYSEAGYIWYDTEGNRKPKYDSQESIYKTLLEELVWARNVLSNNQAVTALGNQYYSLGAYDVLYHNDYNRWAKIANSLILRHGMRMYHKDEEFAGPILQEAYNLPVIDDYYYVGGAFALWPQTLGSQFGDQGWSFREHKNLRMGETVFAQMSKPTDSVDNEIFDPRVYVFFDTNNKFEGYPEGAWRPFPQIRDENTPTEGGTPYSSARDKNYGFKGPACLYSPFNFYLIRDHVFVPQIMISPAEICFIKAEMMVKGIVPGGIGMMTDEMIRKGIELSLNLWLRLPYFGTDATYKYIYPELQEIMDAGDIYSTSYAYASTIFNEVVYNNLDFAYDEKAYLEFIYQQRWLDLFRQPNEAWSLARRTKDNEATTPTTIDHQKLVTYRLPYPQSEVTYNYDNYNDQVRKMSHGDTRETKVWWME